MSTSNGTQVAVLLPTYNGEPFLREQLASLEDQTHTDLVVVTRDDGSTDRSPTIIREWKPAFPVVIDPNSDHLGPARSFYRLVTQAPMSAGMVAYCDQDDIWHPEKVERAVAVLARQPVDRPALYCTRSHFVSEDRESLGLSPLPGRSPGFRNALAHNIVRGCTAVMNRAAADLIADHQPSFPVWHDHWAYLVASAFGTVHFDEWPSIEYRQHANNTIGRNPSRRPRMRNLLRPLGPNSPHLIAREFQLLFGDTLGAEEARILERFIRAKDSRRARLRYALKPDVYRQSSNLAFRARIVIGRF